MNNPYYLGFTALPRSDFANYMSPPKAPVNYGVVKAKEYVDEALPKQSSKAAAIPILATIDEFVLLDRHGNPVAANRGSAASVTLIGTLDGIFHPSNPMAYDFGLASLGQGAGLRPAIIGFGAREAVRIAAVDCMMTNCTVLPRLWHIPTFSSCVVDPYDLLVSTEDRKHVSTAALCAALHVALPPTPTCHQLAVAAHALAVRMSIS